MSFSVKAKEFVPSPTASPWNGNRGTTESSSSSVYSGGAAVPTQHTQKERVCMAYYERAECPFNDSCAHAHHFTELSPDAQATLLMTVSIESIPSHFMSPSPTHLAGHRRGKPEGGAATTSSFTPYGRFNTTTTRGVAAAAGVGNGHNKYSAQGGGSTNGPSARPVARRVRTVEERGAVPVVGPSVFEAASTSSRGSSSNDLGAKPGSPPLTLETFKMRLPARCRYPHSGMPGTYYSFLGVPRSATQEEIIAKYRLWQREAFKRMRAVDPAGAEAADRVIVEARNVLGNPTLREQYDCSLAAAAAHSAAAPLGATGTTKWPGEQSQIQTTTPGSAANPNNVSSSAGTSISLHGGRQHHAHSLSSSMSSLGGSANGHHDHHIPSSRNSLHDRLSPIPTLATNAIPDGIW